MIYFFRKNLKRCLLILIIFSSVIFYLYFGAANEVFIWQNNQRANAYYDPLMRSLANKEIAAQDFLRLVKTRVRNYPQEAQGWYLLSKLELNVNNNISVETTILNYGNNIFGCLIIYLCELLFEITSNHQYI